MNIEYTCMNTQNWTIFMFQHKIVVAGNHELSFDPGTLEESRYYMRQVGEDSDTTKVVTNIMMLNWDSA